MKVKNSETIHWTDTIGGNFWACYTVKLLYG
jgi:hypothetical protein